MNRVILHSIIFYTLLHFSRYMFPSKINYRGKNGRKILSQQYSTPIILSVHKYSYEILRSQPRECSMRFYIFFSKQLYSRVFVSGEN